MLEEIKKGLLAGFGAVLLTKEKIDEVSRKLVNDAKLSKEDAQKLAKELIETGDRRWQDLEKTVTENVRKGLDAFGIGNQNKLQELKDRVEELEKRVKTIEVSSAGTDK
ncbi:MAG: phasin family protein [Deltaproteobacteria bacterium]|nr:phasin family protein [Deltaproteobacteria bacterium]MBW2266363.1 phasin family protein [Deltaproteobacteria bacterium]